MKKQLCNHSTVGPKFSLTLETRISHFVKATDKTHHEEVSCSFKDNSGLRRDPVRGINASMLSYSLYATLTSL